MLWGMKMIHRRWSGTRAFFWFAVLKCPQPKAKGALFLLLNCTQFLMPSSPPEGLLSTALSPSPMLSLGRRHDTTMCRCCCYGHRRPTGRPVAHGNEPNQTKPRRAPKEKGGSPRVISPLCRSITGWYGSYTATVPAVLALASEAERKKRRRKKEASRKAMHRRIGHASSLPLRRARDPRPISSSAFYLGMGVILCLLLLHC